MEGIAQLLEEMLDFFRCELWHLLEIRHNELQQVEQKILGIGRTQSASTILQRNVGHQSDTVEE